MTTTEISSRWDRLLLGVVAVVGVYAFLLVVAGLFVGDALFDPLGFGPDDGDASERGREYLQLIYAVLGAVIVGWMVTIGGLARGPLRRREAWAWNTVALASVMWFTLDTGASVVLGFVGHAAFNVVFAVALAVPLLAIRREIRGPNADPAR